MGRFHFIFVRYGACIDGTAATPKHKAPNAMYMYLAARVVALATRQAMAPPPTSSTTKSATRLSLLFSPFHRPSSAVIVCLGALAAVTVLNIVFTFYTIRTVRDLLPPTREWSESTVPSKCCLS